MVTFIFTLLYRVVRISDGQPKLVSGDRHYVKCVVKSVIPYAVTSYL
jgi:hypothetical protein